MAEIYTAFSSEVKVNQETIEGLQAIEYSQSNSRRQVGAIGTIERIGVYFGMKVVAGRLSVASANKTLDQLVQSRDTFSIIATLRHGETTRTLSFDDCYMEDKEFALGAEGHAQTIYAFTATRLREE
jgi:hypothetical protein